MSSNSFDANGRALCNAEKMGSHDEQLKNLKASQNEVQEELKSLRRELKEGQEEVREDIREMVKVFGDYIREDRDCLNKKIENLNKNIEHLKTKSAEWDTTTKVVNIVASALVKLAWSAVVAFGGYLFWHIFKLGG